MSKFVSGSVLFLLLVALGTALGGYFVNKKAYSEACALPPESAAAEKEPVDKRKKLANILNIVALASTGLSLLILLGATFKKDAPAAEAAKSA